jgi:hypothetical protein
VTAPAPRGAPAFRVPRRATAPPWCRRSPIAPAGLVQAGGPLTLTEQGRGRYGQIRRAIDELTARLFDFPADELATAGRVLSIVTTRANAELAAD